jgi:hypothetical protein
MCQEIGNDATAPHPAALGRRLSRPRVAAWKLSHSLWGGGRKSLAASFMASAISFPRIRVATRDSLDQAEVIAEHQSTGKLTHIKATVEDRRPVVRPPIG